MFVIRPQRDAIQIVAKGRRSFSCSWWPINCDTSYVFQPSIPGYPSSLRYILLHLHEAFQTFTTLTCLFEYSVLHNSNDFWPQCTNDGSKTSLSLQRDWPLSSFVRVKSGFSCKYWTMQTIGRYYSFGLVWRDIWQWRRWHVRKRDVLQLEMVEAWPPSN